MFGNLRFKDVVLFFIWDVYKYVIVTLVHIFYSAMPVDNKKIVLVNYINKGYCCNLKYISQELLKRNLSCKIVWITSEQVDYEKSFPDGIKVVDMSKHKFEALKELATAKVWVTNYRQNVFYLCGLKKKFSQKYINTWHGSMGIKKVDFEMKSFVNSSNRNWLDISEYDAKSCDYAISNSSFETDVYKSGMKYANILEVGHPRNDVFFLCDNYEEIKNKIYNLYGISSDKKVLFYAPSHRDNRRMDWFNINFDLLKKSAESRWGSDFVIAIRMHPRLRKQSKFFIKESSFIIDVSEYEDIQELMLISDVMITDYSSCIYDFVLSRKPGFIYAEDIQKYNNERGLYYPLEETPFPVASDNETLQSNILEFNEKDYQMNVSAFLERRGCCEKGNASQRVVDLIEKIIYGEIK